MPEIVGKDFFASTPAALHRRFISVQILERSTFRHEDRSQEIPVSRQYPRSARQSFSVRRTTRCFPLHSTSARRVFRDCTVMKRSSEMRMPVVL